ncbi:hypothetical protein HWX41_07055 [Bacillus paramycoides]|uniref:hypothetical protein n=1 Tax=Bacillus paramycoides TaxID=2026194 RepID=UPI0015BEBB04|nr:hypothetical protein [Bacillus paramycoides]NWK68879.1 hypothetical protein [Bacillus paramycoides]
MKTIALLFIGVMAFISLVMLFKEEFQISCILMLITITFFWLYVHKCSESLTIALNIVKL